MGFTFGPPPGQQCDLCRSELCKCGPRRTDAGVLTVNDGRIDPTKSEPWPTIIEALNRVAVACRHHGMAPPLALRFGAEDALRLGLAYGESATIATSGGEVQVVSEEQPEWRW